MPSRSLASVLLLALFLAACASRPPGLPVVADDPSKTAPHGTYKLGTPYEINGVRYFPEYDPGYEAVGIASWYGRQFHGRATANGEIFDMYQVSAAHPTLPLPSLVEVTNLETNRSLRLRVNDRGPFHDNRLIDLSQAAARELGFEGRGLARVRVRFLSLLPAAGTPPVAGASSRPTVIAAAVPEPQATESRSATHSASASRSATRAASAPRSATRSASAADRPGSAGGCGVDGHFVQVAAFSERANAHRLAGELGGIGRVEVDEAAAPPTRVRLGPYPSRRAAFGKLALVHGLGYPDALVIGCS